MLGRDRVQDIYRDKYIAIAGWSRTEAHRRAGGRVGRDHRRHLGRFATRSTIDERRLADRDILIQKARVALPVMFAAPGSTTRRSKDSDGVTT